MLSRRNAIGHAISKPPAASAAPTTALACPHGIGTRLGRLVTTGSGVTGVAPNAVLARSSAACVRPGPGRRAVVGVARWVSRGAEPGAHRGGGAPGYDVRLYADICARMAPKPMMSLRHLLLATILLAPPLAAQRIAFDPHLDLPKSATTPGWNGKTDPTSQFDLDRASAGGLNVAAVALFVPQGARDPSSLATAQRELVAKDLAIHAIAERNPAIAALALAPGDIRRNLAQHRFSVVESLLNAWPLGDDVDALDHWYGRGVRILGFVHAGNNQYADSSRPALTRGDKPDENGGLTPLGKAAVKRLNDLGVLIDVSQLSDAAFDQVLALSRAPVIATHSDIRALVPNGRNLTDGQLDAIRAKGGVVAINAFSVYLRVPGSTPSMVPATAQHDITSVDMRATVTDLANAVDYAVKRIGIDHVALSSDFNHGGGIIGWSDVGEIRNVTAELGRHGYTPAQIDKLWGGNVLRVWQAAIDARDRHYRARTS